MHRLPPNVPGVVTPEQLLSKDEMLILQEHYRKVRYCKNDEARNKALNEWTDRQRVLVRSLYERLFANGFVVEDQEQSGRLHFGYRLKSEMQQVMELSEEDYRAYQTGGIVFDGNLKRLVRVRQHACQG